MAHCWITMHMLIDLSRGRARTHTQGRGAAHRAQRAGAVCHDGHGTPTMHGRTHAHAHACIRLRAHAQVLDAAAAHYVGPISEAVLRLRTLLHEYPRYRTCTLTHRRAHTQARTVPHASGHDSLSMCGIGFSLTDSYLLLINGTAQLVRHQVPRRCCRQHITARG
jgi:hypothetical protein